MNKAKQTKQKRPRIKTVVLVTSTNIKKHLLAKDAKLVYQGIVDKFTISKGRYLYSL